MNAVQGSSPALRQPAAVLDPLFYILTTPRHATPHVDALWEPTRRREFPQHCAR